VHLSPRWKSMLGFESHELANDMQAWRARVHPAERSALEQALARHLDGAEARFDHEMRLLHKDGSVRHVLSRGVAIRRESGEPYRMVGLDTDVTRLRRVQAVLDAVADGTAGASGERFFAAMVQHFARALEVDCAFIAECVDHPPTRVRTLAFWSAADGVVENFEFALAGTPCDEVLNEGRACFHRQGLAELFPREAGFEAYLGMPIIASDGRVLGHLALFDKQPLGDEVLVDRVYRIFLARAAAEMERMQALAQLALTASTA
jgi:PAS domain S-box-containing protein